MLLENITKKVELQLVGTDGNAYAIMSKFRKTALRQGWTKEEVEAVINKAMSGDYDNLLATIQSFCE